MSNQQPNQCACLNPDPYECTRLRYGTPSQHDEACDCACHDNWDEYEYEEHYCDCDCGCRTRVPFAGNRCGMCVETCFGDSGGFVP